MTLQEDISNARNLWTEVLPEVPAPPDSTLRLWLVEHSVDAYERALAYAPRRVERLRKNGRYTPLAVHKYVSTFLHQTKTEKMKEPTLLAAIDALTCEQAKDPANTVRVLNMFVLSELISYQKANFFSHVSPQTLRDIRLLQETSDPKSAHNLAAKIVDSLECSSLNDGDATGAALKRLAQIERTIEARSLDRELKSQQNPTRGSSDC